MKNKNILFGILFLSVILFSGFIMAATSPSVTFEGNTTNQYDKEGSFFVNWTEGGDSAINYTIYIYVDDVFFTSAMNDSALGYTFSNTTDANYTFTVEGENATNIKTNSTNLSMIVDTTVPLLSYNTNTETDGSGDNRSYIFVNVSASDTNNHSIKYELWNTTAMVFQNVTDATTMNWTGLTKSVKYTFNVSMNDSATNSNSTSTRTFYLDGVNPSASASCNNIYRGNDLDCSCSTSDNLELSSTSTSTDASDGTGSQHSTGTFTFTCSATDKAGNSKSSTASYTVRSSGGGSTSSSAWSEEKTSSVVKNSFGSSFIVGDFGSDIGVNEIEVNVENEVQSVKITVRKYDDKPAEVSVSKEGNVNQYLEINSEDLENNLENARVSIRVSKSWVNQNDLSRDDIALFRFDEENENWDELPTNFAEEDGDYYYYDSELTSFSFFVISEKSLEEEAEEESSGIGDVFGGEEGDESSSSKPWIWIVIGIIVLGAVIYYSQKKNKK